MSSPDQPGREGREGRPPIAVVISFLDCINRGDVEGLGRLMADDHELMLFDEEPVVGRDANVEAWRGYAERFPAYVIWPRRITTRGDRVAVLGHTTGSHLALPDGEERKLTLIWQADVVDGAVRRWQLLDDTPDRRRHLGLDTA